jgi:O-antigen ligase
MIRTERSRWLDERIAWPLVCLFVFSIPWEKSVVAPGLGTFSRLLGLCALAAAAGAAWMRGSLRAPNLALVVAGCFAAWTGLTFFWSVSPAETADRALTFAQLAAMLWLIWETCRTSARQARLLEAYVAGAAIASLLTLARYAQGLQTYYLRYAAPGFDPNSLGLTVALSIPLALYLAARDHGFARWFYRAAVALAVAAVLLSASRTALIVTFCGFSFVLFTWRGTDRAQRVWSVILFGLLLSGILYLAPSSSRQRLRTMPTEATGGILRNRTQIWKAGVKVFLSRPLVGVGAGAFPEAVRPRLGTPALPGHRYVAHNTYLSVLVECGLAGFGLFALWLGVLAVYVWIMKPPERALWSVVLAAWAIGVMTLSWEHRKVGWLLAGLIMTEWARSFRRGQERA